MKIHKVKFLKHNQMTNMMTVYVGYRILAKKLRFCVGVSI